MGKINFAWIIGISIMVIAVVGIFALAFGSSKPGITGSATSATESNSFTIPLSDITDKAKFYEYDFAGKTIRFFAVKAYDGSIKTGFDACDVCHSSGKGYRQEGDFMVCNNCGNKYPIIGLGTENTNPGGCWPGYLASSINGDNLVIQKAEIEAGRQRFV